MDATDTLMYRTIFLSIAIFSAALPNAWAEENWYQIEYILFHHKNADLATLEFEHTPKAQPTPSEGKAFRYYRPRNESAFNTDPSQLSSYDEVYANTISPFHLYPTDASVELELANAHTRLKRDPRTVVYHYRHWQQSFSSTNDQLPVQIYQKMDRNTLLEGFIRIDRERYLHANINVSLKTLNAYTKVDWAEEAMKAQPPQNEWLNTNWQAPGLSPLFDTFEYDIPGPYMDSPLCATTSVYDFSRPMPIIDQLLPFNEHYLWHQSDSIDFVASRRVKDQELHYVDHPFFGLIVTIKRIDDPRAIESSADFDNVPVNLTSSGPES